LSLLREANAANEIRVSRIGTQEIKSRVSPQPEEQFLRASLKRFFQPSKGMIFLADAGVKYRMAIRIARILFPLRPMLFQIRPPVPLSTKTLVRTTKTREALRGSFFVFTVKNSSLLCISIVLEMSPFRSYAVVTNHRAKPLPRSISKMFRPPSMAMSYFRPVNSGTAARSAK
jgi:hypothetical protein